MASDNLNQVGKFIGRTGRNADRAVKKAYPINPRLERARDVFDSTVAFEMDFKKEDQDKRVMLDLFFNLPPPIRGCKVGCIFTKCEEFDFESGGNHYVTVTNPYLPTSVTVFVNGEALASSQIFESNPAAGEVYFQGTSGPDRVAVCYVYTDCPTSENIKNCEVFLAPSFGNAQLLFSDRYDRAESLETWGGMGYYYVYEPSLNLDIFDPYQISQVSGSWPSSFTYTFEDIRAAGTYGEQILAADLSFWFNAGNTLTISPTGTAGQYDYQGTAPTMRIDGAGGIRITAPYRYKLASAPNDNWSFDTTIKTASIDPVIMKQKVFIRFLVLDQQWRAKVWPMDQAEPVEWSLVVGPEAATSTQILKEYYKTDFIGGKIDATGGNTLILAIEHWVPGNTLDFGTWNAAPRADNSWYRRIDIANYESPVYLAHPGNTYFGLGSVHVDTLNEFATTVDMKNVLNDQGHFPVHQYEFTSGFFNTGGGPPELGGLDAYNVAIFKGSTEQYRAYDTIIGKPYSFKIQGEIAWQMSSATVYAPSLDVAILEYTNGGTPPGEVGQKLAGVPKLLLNMPVSIPDSVGPVGGPTGYRWASAWTPFEVEINTASEFTVAWGVHFIQTGDEVAAQIVYINSDSGLRTTELYTVFRNLIITATTAPIGPARPICPDDGILARCPAVIDGGNGDTIERCEDGDFDGWIASSGQQWHIDTLTYASIVLNNTIRTNFKATGVTFDGSDGRCPWFSEDENDGITSLTFGEAYFFIENAPTVCGDSSIFLEFKYGNVPISWHSVFGDDIVPRMSIGIGTQISGSNGIRIQSSPGNPTSGDNDVESNNLMFGGNFIDPTPLHANTWYSLRMEYRKDNVRVKFWDSAISEPTAWIWSGQPQQPYGGEGLYIDVTYENYNDDDFYAEFKNILVSPLEGTF